MIQAASGKAIWAASSSSRKLRDNIAIISPTDDTFGFLIYGPLLSTYFFTLVPAIHNHVHPGNTTQ
jgi:hypothetical protein